MEVVTGGGEDGVGAVAVSALEMVAVQAVLGLEVTKKGRMSARPRTSPGAPRFAFSFLTHSPHQKSARAHPEAPERDYGPIWCVGVGGILSSKVSDMMAMDDAAFSP